jgi:cyclopropane-fatty-acyl-phospholipid synthase
MTTNSVSKNPGSKNPGSKSSVSMIPPAEPIQVTKSNLGTLGLDPLTRQAFAYGLLTRRGSLTVRLPDQRWFRFVGEDSGTDAVLIVNDGAFARRAVMAGDIGVAEAYIAGEWESPDVTAFLEFFASNTEAIEVLFAGKPYMRVIQWLRHLLNRNTKRQAQKNIHSHYDLGNRFYQSWLDRTMTYSSGIYAPGDNDLASAQTRKYRALAEAIELKPGHHVLEIGCGWGGFAEFASREYGCRVTGLTISREQLAFAEERIAKAGLSDLVTLRYQDYRDEQGTYDRVASIEMFEAVGEAYWPAYFAKVEQTLKPGGRAGIQVITIQDRFFAQYRREIDFIRRYIFPGGMLPTPTILQSLGTKAGLLVSSELVFGLDYARTLVEWRDRFREAWPRIEPMGFDLAFKRLWEYYLHYCEAGFRAGNIDVRQVVFSKG